MHNGMHKNHRHTVRPYVVPVLASPMPIRTQAGPIRDGQVRCTLSGWSHQGRTSEVHSVRLIPSGTDKWGALCQADPIRDGQVRCTLSGWSHQGRTSEVHSVRLVPSGADKWGTLCQHLTGYARRTATLTASQAQLAMTLHKSRILSRLIDCF
jgi:hypothetical protein